MIKITCTTKITSPTHSDKPMKDFIERMKKVKDAYVAIGIHEGAGSYEDGTSVVNVAAWNEFGTESIPARAFIRNTLFENDSVLNSWRKDLMNQIIAGKITMKKALDTIGFRLRELMKAQINSRRLMPDAPSTIEHKKREGVSPPDTPLYETGLLMRSIEFKSFVK